MRLRKIRPDEGELLRRVRLDALTDAPTAFDSSLSGERALPAETWERRAASGAAGDTAVTFFAEDAGECVGLVTGLWDGNGDHGAMIVSMWVDRRARGHGFGQRFLDAVVRWAAERGAPRVDLWVAEDNGPARRLYEAAGFAPTGVRVPLESDPSRIGVQLSLPLTG